MLCPRIQKYISPSIKTFVDEIEKVENNLKNDKEYDSMKVILSNFTDIGTIDSPGINSDIINKMALLGLANVSLDNDIKITRLGKILNEKLG